MSVNDFRQFMSPLAEDAEIQQFIDLALELGANDGHAVEWCLKRIASLVRDGYSFNAIRSILRKGGHHAR